MIAGSKKFPLLITSAHIPIVADFSLAMEHILLIENDPTTQQMITSCCATLDAIVETIPAPAPEINHLWQKDWALLLLATMLPDSDGLSLLRQIRATSRVPVLLLVSPGNEVDGILGLELGADVYLIKPLNPRVLLAQVRALLRRVRTDGYNVLPPPPLKLGEIELDEQLHAVRYAGQQLELTFSEYNLMRLLLRANGKVIARETLSQELLGRSFSPRDRSLDVHVSNLRRKLTALTQQPGSYCIRAERGVGYALTLG